MKQLILAQLAGFATRTIMGVIADLVKILQERTDSSVQVDGDKIIELLKKNAKEDIEAGYNLARSYTNNAQK